jgi:hypothetical protein
VLLAGQGKQDIEIAQLSISPNKAGRWRNRFLDAGIEGLKKDAPRPGRTPRITPEMVREVIARTTQTKPANATHWSTRALAAELGISDSSVLRIWRTNGLKPHLVETFKVSNDPQIRRQTGGHRRPLSQPARACTGAFRAAKASAPGVVALPASHSSGNAAGQAGSHYLRQLCDAQTCGGPALAQPESAIPRPLHADQRILNMVERFFRDLSANRLKRGVFRDLEELIMAVGDYIDRHNEKPKPFIWTASARDILEKVTRARKSLDKLQAREALH